MALSDNLISWWTMDEASGTRADSHGSNDLDDINTVGSTTGKISNAASFTSANSEKLRITDASQSGLDITGDISVSLWVRFDTLSVDHSLVGKFGVSNQQSYLVNLNTSNLFRFQISDDGSSVETYSVNPSFSTGTWYHLVVTWDASASTAKFYLNGSQTGGDQTGSKTSIYNGTGEFEIGSYLGGARYLNGDMDEVGIWNRVLSSAEVTSLYNSGSAITYDDFAATNVTVNPSAQSATFSIPTYTPSAQQQVSISPNVQSASFSIPAYSLSQGSTISPAAQVATFSIPTYVVDLPDATVYPNAQVATFSIPSYEVRYGWVISQGAPPVATFSIPAYSVGIGATINPDAQVATFSIPAYSLYYDYSVAIAGAVSATFSIPTYAITAQTLISAGVQVATFSIPTYTVTGELNKVVTPDTQVLTFSLPTLVHFGAVWEKKARATNSTWARSSRNSD